MVKQFFSSIYTKYSPKFYSKCNKFSDYLAKERMIPPQNSTRYLIGGAFFIVTYYELDKITELYPINKKIKVVEGNYTNTIITHTSETKRILNNLVNSAAIGTVAWYAPYIMCSLWVFNNYTNHSNTLLNNLKYLYPTNNPSVTIEDNNDDKK